MLVNCDEYKIALILARKRRKKKCKYKESIREERKKGETEPARKRIQNILFYIINHAANEYNHTNNNNNLTAILIALDLHALLALHRSMFKSFVDEVDSGSAKCGNYNFI